MSLIDNVKKALDKFRYKDVGAYANSPVDKMPVVTEWFFSAPYGQPRNIDITEIRQFGLGPWITMVINTISREVSQTPWDIVVEDEEGQDTKDYEEQIKKVKNILKYPNRNGETTEVLFKKLVKDICELDSGVIFKAR